MFWDECLTDDPITQCLSHLLRDHQVYILLQEGCRYLHATTVIAPRGSIRGYKEFHFFMAPSISSGGCSRVSYSDYVNLFFCYCAFFKRYISYRLRCSHQSCSWRSSANMLQYSNQLPKFDGHRQPLLLQRPWWAATADSILGHQPSNRA